MSRLLGILLALLLLPWPTARADEGDALVESGAVRVELQVDPAEPYVGQRAKLRLILKTNSFFRGAPTFRLPDPRGAIVRQESAFAVNGSESIDGETFATQTWDLDLYAQSDRAIRVPPIEVTMQVAEGGTKTIPVTTRTEALEVQPKRPDGVEADQYVPAAKGFTMAVMLDPADGTGLQVGDALTRTVTMAIEDAPGMLIAPLPTFERTGMRAYPSEPRVEDKSDRGSLTGTRIESVSYAFEQPGTYELPGYEVPWFDLASGTLKTASVPAVTVEVAANPDLAAGTTAGPGGEGDAAGSADLDDDRLWIPLAGLLTMLAAAWVAWRRFGPQIEAKLAAARAAREASEAASFERFEAACESGDPHAALNALLAWVDRRAAPDTGSLEALADAHPPLRTALAELDAHLFVAEPRTGPWRGEPLRAAVAAARDEAQRVDERAAADPLPTLNPRAS